MRRGELVLRLEYGNEAYERAERDLVQEMDAIRAWARRHHKPFNETRLLDAEQRLSACDLGLAYAVEYGAFPGWE